MARISGGRFRACLGTALTAGLADYVTALRKLLIGEGISRFIKQLAAALAVHGLTLVTHLAGAYGRPLPDVCATLEAHRLPRHPLLLPTLADTATSTWPMTCCCRLPGRRGW